MIRKAIDLLMVALTFSDRVIRTYRELQEERAPKPEEATVPKSNPIQYRSDGRR